MTFAIAQYNPERVIPVFGIDYLIIFPVRKHIIAHMQLSAICCAVLFERIVDDGEYFFGVSHQKASRVFLIAGRGKLL